MELRTKKLNIACMCQQPCSFKVPHLGSPWVLGHKFLYEQKLQKYSLDNNDKIVNKIQINKPDHKTREELSCLALHGNITPFSANC